MPHVPIHSTASAAPFVAPKKQVMTAWGLVDADMFPIRSRCGVSVEGKGNYAR